MAATTTTSSYSSGSVEQLAYFIYDFSSFSGEFSPKHILVDKPTDQKSRWLSDGNKPPQYITLRLTKPAIVSRIVFGKYEKKHPCNIQKLRVFGGLEAEHTHLLFEGELKNDNISETLDLQFLVNNQPFPSRYIKIVPLQSWGGGFNFSIWHVKLWGTAEAAKVENALVSLRECREREAVRLCLKHLRQHDYSEAFEALQKKSKVLLEDPILTQFHREMVSTGNFEEAERILSSAMERGFFDGHVARQMTRAKWTNIPYPVLTTLQSGPSLPTPDMRGGHQMCIDPDAGQLFLYGGWNGTKELGDLWQFTIATNKWTCLSVDSSQEGGPGPRSCHSMCFNPELKALYVLGGNVDGLEHSASPLPCALHIYSIVTNSWHLLSSDTFKDGGPHAIFDHQMCYDRTSGLLYVVGGHISFTNVCSGLYAYHTVNKQWMCLEPDQSHDPNAKATLPRSGHVACFHPTLYQLFIIGGHRQREILSDMLTYDVKSGEMKFLSNVPVCDFTLRGALDVSKNQICVTSLSKLEERELRVSNSLWLYDISLSQWSKVTRDEKIPLYDVPIPRYAHSFVYDSASSCYYMFGGNPRSTPQAKSASNLMRLDDFWTMRLIRQSKENFLRELKFILRKQRFIEYSASSPVAAVEYLKTHVNAVVDHSDHDESRQYRELAGVLFNSEPAEQVPSRNLLRMRGELYDTIATYFPEELSQPADNIIDFIKLKK